MDYSKIISKRVADVPPSGIRKFFDLASEMKDAISLGVGEPDFVTPWNIREAAIYSIERGHTHYTSNHGMIELRELIEQYMSERFNLSYTPGQIMVTVGASEAIDLSLRAIIEPGDEVLVPEPCYVSYMPKVLFAGGVPVPIQMSDEDEFKFTVDNVKPLINDRTKAIIVAFPNNPTGAIMTENELKPIAELLADKNIIAISDEVYAELTYQGKHTSIASLDGMWDRTIVINGFSKAFAMTGWRLGYICAPTELLNAMLKIHQFTMLCAPIMSQAAGVEALRAGFENNFADVERMRREYNRRRRVIVDGFRDMGLSCFEPMGAFYAYPCVEKTGMTADRFCEGLIKSQKVACVPSTAFGNSNSFMRCSYATSLDNINEALKRIRAYLQEI
ncbi:MAG: aminotransferase class I/II-fold pyridoxal phosphate-dependent enzyme [Bacillota bacterium]